MKKITFVLVVLCTALLVLSACGGSDGGLTSAQSASAESATSLVASAVVKQSDVEIYSYTKEISLRNDEATITITEIKLNGSFENEENTESESCELDRSQLIGLAFDGNVVVSENETSQTDGVKTTILKGTVSKDKISTLLQSEIVASGDATFTATLTDGKLQLFQLDFSISNDTLGELNVVCSYEYGF